LKSRICNPNDYSYKSYGGRGIKLCARWYDYSNFFADMGERPSGCSIDRIDVNGDYTPENCRWATNKVQQRNRRDNVYITYDGKRKTIAEWEEFYNAPHGYIYRTYRTHTFEEVLRMLQNWKRKHNA
jgi:hypothetical protein